MSAPLRFADLLPKPIGGTTTGGVEIKTEGGVVASTTSGERSKDINLVAKVVCYDGEKPWRAGMEGEGKKGLLGRYHDGQDGYGKSLGDDKAAVKGVEGDRVKVAATGAPPAAAPAVVVVTTPIKPAKERSSEPTGQKKKKSSKYRGVTLAYITGGSKPWKAQISVEGKYKSLGYFATEEEGARAYDRAAKIYHGPKAVLNFYDDDDGGGRPASTHTTTAATTITATTTTTTTTANGGGIVDDEEIMSSGSELSDMDDDEEVREPITTTTTTTTTTNISKSSSGNSLLGKGSSDGSGGDHKKYDPRRASLSQPPGSGKRSREEEDEDEDGDGDAAYIIMGIKSQGVPKKSRPDDSLLPDHTHSPLRALSTAASSATTTTTTTTTATSGSNRPTTTTTMPAYSPAIKIQPRPSNGSGSGNGGGSAGGDGPLVIPFSSTIKPTTTATTLPALASITIPRLASIVAKATAGGGGTNGPTNATTEMRSQAIGILAKEISFCVLNGGTSDRAEGLAKAIELVEKGLMDSVFQEFFMNNR